MGQILSSTLFTTNTNELGLMLHCTYDTQYHHLTSIKLQPEGSLFAVANEARVLLIYDYLSALDNPQQSKIFGYEYGGISELFWISQDILAVGTTRGHIVMLSLKKNKKYAIEICCVKAHGDGAIQVAVQCIDYCPHTKRLVSVGQGVASIRIWNVSEDGKLTAVPGSEKGPTTYCEPRFVCFLSQGSQVLVGYLENASVQHYSVEGWALHNEFILGQMNGAPDSRQLGNGMTIKENRFVLHNLRDGVDIFDSKADFALLGSAHFKITHCCSQGISALQNGRYFVSPSTRGRIHIYRSQDCMLITKLRVSGRNSQIKAVHSSNTAGDNGNVVIATSYSETQPTKISIWMDSTQHFVAISSRQAGESSRLQLVVLCVLVCTLCQLAAFAIPALTSDHIACSIGVFVLPRKSSLSESSPTLAHSSLQPTHAAHPDATSWTPGIHGTSVHSQMSVAVPMKVDFDHVDFRIGDLDGPTSTMTDAPNQVALASIHPAIQLDAAHGTNGHRLDSHC